METKQQVLCIIPKEMLNIYVYQVLFNFFLAKPTFNSFCSKTLSSSMSHVRVWLLVNANVKRMQAGPPQCCKRNCTSGWYTSTRCFRWRIWALTENNREWLKYWLCTISWINQCCITLLLYHANNLLFQKPNSSYQSIYPPAKDIVG